MSTLLCAGGVIGAATNVAASEAEQLLEQAIGEYADALELSDRDRQLVKFGRAEQLFKQAIDLQLTSGRVANADLLTNWGNAALQAEHTGVAILAFRRALRVDPSHAAASQNLSYARSTLPEWTRRSDESSVVDTLFFWRQVYSATFIAGMAAACFMTACALVAASLVFNKSIWRAFAWIPLLVWLALAGSAYWQGDTAKDEAIVVADNVIVYSADSENAKPRISQPIPNGTEVKMLQSRDRWTEVQLGGKSGWVRTAEIEPIVAD